MSIQGSEMRSHLTPTGLLFLTLSDETCAFEDFFPGFEALTAHADFTQFPLRRPLRYTSNNNWKAAVDAYQECLHCAYAHPEFAKIYKPSVYQVVNKHNYSQHMAGSSSQAKGLKEAGLFFYFFPNCTLSMYAGGLTCWRINPTEEPGKSRMEFDYYHQAPLESEEFENYYRFARNVALEDIELCEKAQTNYNVGIYSEGLLNPQKENGVACKLMSRLLPFPVVLGYRLDTFLQTFISASLSCVPPSSKKKRQKGLLRCMCRPAQ